MKKVVIIGGGIAGMTAGIYLQQAGFATEIYEKHTTVGGQCTGWNRKGYHIDNCIHWLTGTREGNGLHALWENIGALGDDVKLYAPQSFYKVTWKGESITFWRDLERTRKEMLALSPEDEKEINKFIDYTKLAEEMSVPVEKPFDMMTLGELMKLGKSMAGMSRVLKEYGHSDMKELSLRFRHPLLQKAMISYMPTAYQSYSMLVSYGTVASGNGDIPLGGSKKMAERIAGRYEQLGGVIYQNSPVARILLPGAKPKKDSLPEVEAIRLNAARKNAAVGILLKNGEKITADYIVCACDTNFTFSQLLPEKYMPRELKKAYNRRDLYPVTSGFQIAFAVDGKFKELESTNVHSCRSIKIAGSVAEGISYRGYDFEPDFAPEGKTILQSNFLQTEEDFAYWEKLFQNREEYNSAKLEYAEQVKERLLEIMPFLKDKLQIIDVWTPMTYHLFYNSYHGAYMGFIITKRAKDQRIPGKIKGLDNVVIASQWLMGPGGLPTAAAMGKFAAQRIEKKESGRA